MFKVINPQQVSNGSGINVAIDGAVLRYQDGDHAMELGVEPCPPLSPQYDVLVSVTFPAQARWKSPYDAEPVDKEKLQRIEQHIIEALAVLNCEVDFFRPFNGTRP